MRTWNRLHALFHRAQLDREFDEEARLHIEMATDEYLERGYSPGEARRLARLSFGAAEASKDAYRDSRGFPRLESLAHDFRSAVHGLRRAPGYTFTAVVMLALAIGLNAAVFAVVNTMLFRGFPLVKDNRRLLYMQERYTLPGCCLLYPDFLAWRAQAKSFQDVALVGGKAITLTDGAATRETSAATVTANAFRLLGVQPILGRDFVPGDEAPGAPQVLMLSYEAWTEQFAKRADIVGHDVTIDKAPATIIGVMPEGFAFPEHDHSWMPLQPTPAMLKGKPSGFMAFGRLANGATRKKAAAEIDFIDRRLEAEFPATNKGVRAYVRTYSEFQLGPDASMIYGSVWAAAWFVLIIACANLANLNLARTLGRSREISTRIALGAGRWRMARQMLIEGLLLASIGGSLGWWLAQTGIRIWIAATYTRYVVLDYSIGWTNVWYLAAVTLVVAILFGLIPMASAVRMDVNATLRGDRGNATMTRSAKHLSRALVAGQTALAIVLLAGAGVLVRSLWSIVGADIGVKGADKVLVGFVNIPRDEVPSAETRNLFWDRLRSDVASIPGIDSVAIANTVPVANPGTVPFQLTPGPWEGERKPLVTTISTGPGYLHAVGAQLLAGREFVDSDNPDSPKVAMVNERFAASYWAGDNPLGKRLRLPGKNDAPDWYTVVGIASNIMQNQPLRDKFVPIVYVPYRQNPSNAAAVFVRTVVTPGQVASRVRAAIEKASPSVVLEDYSTLQSTFTFDRDRMDLEHAELGKHAAVAPVFAVIALLLAVVGLYAVATHSVRRRSREIGVRMALGSDAAAVRQMVVRGAMVPVFAGWAVGIIGSLAVNRVLGSQLVGVKPDDPLTIAIVTVLLFLVAALGCLLPARRASLVDPARVLRHS